MQVEQVRAGLVPAAAVSVWIAHAGLVHDRDVARSLVFSEQVRNSASTPLANPRLAGSYCTARGDGEKSSRRIFMCLGQP